MRFAVGYGHYFVEGVGYATIQAILLGHLAAPGLLLLLFAGKIFATSVSLGSGSSGGIFSPSLFMGATIGAAFAALLSLLPLPMAIDAPSFALVGMGAMVGGGTGAVMTAVAMIFEMTRDYDIVMPMIIAVAFSVGTRRLLSRENIYTLSCTGAAISCRRRCTRTCSWCGARAKSWTRISPRCRPTRALRRFCAPPKMTAGCATSS